MSSVAPTDLEGLAGIWKIAGQASDAKVCDAVVNLLLQIHTQVSDDLKSRIAEFEDMYIEQVINNIK